MRPFVIGCVVVGGVLGALYLWGKRPATAGDLGDALASGPGAGAGYGKDTLPAGSEYGNGAYDNGRGSWGRVTGEVGRLFGPGGIPAPLHPTKGFAA
jgi:hypothetical protein